jgi:hypothetical protein
MDVMKHSRFLMKSHRSLEVPTHFFLFCQARGRLEASSCTPELTIDFPLTANIRIAISGRQIEDAEVTWIVYLASKSLDSSN